jgi:hypothetical protein
MYRILSWFLFQFNLIINCKLSKIYYRFPFFTFQNVIVSLMFFCFVGIHGQLEPFTLLQFGVQWFCSPFPVERCPEMELMQTYSSTSYMNVSFAYVGVHSVYAVFNSWVK